MNSERSKLCENCKIFGICHEPQKYIAQSCIHFVGNLPQGFVKYRNVAIKFVPNNWKGHRGYFVRKWGREWIMPNTWEWNVRNGDIKLSTTIDDE